MECNKDEAIRAKEIGERKLLERDIAGAKKFALKAQSLCPQLDGIAQLLRVIHLYVVEEQKINGMVDYYAIFGVNSSTDEESLRKQYKKLALALHPDKNKSVGADGAFKILSQAWSVLSDKDKRHDYNLRMKIASLNLRTSADNPQNPAKNYTSHNFGGSSSSSSAMNAATATDPVCVPTRSRTPATSLGFQNIPKRRRTSAPFDNSQSSSAPTTSSQNVDNHQKIPSGATGSQFIPRDSQKGSSNHPSTTETFWTVCSRCRMHYAYRKIFINQNLICPHCCHAFIAAETPAPDINSRGSGHFGFFHQKKGAFAAPSSTRSVPVSASRDTHAATAPLSEENLKRKPEETVSMATGGNPQQQSSTRTEQGEECSASETHSSGLKRKKQPKRRRADGQNWDSSKGVKGTAGIRTGLKKASGNTKGIFGARPDVSSSSGKRGSVKESSPREIRAMLMAVAKKDILGKLDEWNTAESKSSDVKKAEQKASKSAPGEDKISADSEDKLHPSKSIPKDTDDVKPDEPVSMSVPDADFHNFDDDRVESSFAANQVWAAYDDDDGMPRYYAVIHQVISREPFQMQMSWLNSKTSSEFGSLGWCQHGFSKTSGDFRVGKYRLMESLNTFSHPVKWRKGEKGSIQIFPAMGDVWALYKNWSPNWDELTSDDIIHVYNLVMVLQDYDIDAGVRVTPLVKVPGFTSVFRQNLDQTEIIPRQEMFRFSHQVPSYKLDEDEGRNIPNGCYELDPAALPLELLKVITGDVEEKREKAAEDPVELRGPEQPTSSASGMVRTGVEYGKPFLTYSRKKGKQSKRC